MAGRRRSTSSPFSIGNCKVKVDGGSVVCESKGNGIVLSKSDHTRIRISESNSKKETSTRCYSRRQSRHAVQGGKLPWLDHTFVLLNPKDGDNCSKSLLQEALMLYMEELPTMNYAANTGKASQFLERCLTSGKYSTLIISANTPEGSRKVIAAVTFQIVPVDMQYAEIPLTAVSLNFQRKGIGCMIYGELKERLRSIGISTVFCWADKESELFWLKQDFIAVGEVDGKGRARKLPVRADIRRALCFPGAATLMVAHLKKDIVNFLECFLNVDSKASGKANDFEDNGATISQLRRSKKNNYFADMGNIMDVAERSCHADERFFAPGKQRNSRVWEASLSSLKSKRVKGNHVTDDSMSSDKNFTMDSLSCYPLSTEIPVSVTHDSTINNHSGRESSALQSGDGGFEKTSPRIMFMNIADEDKKAMLTKIVEELGGSVTSCGSSSTHVITGKARRTLNFCLSLCAGTWIVSASWLKSSFREGKFLDESQHILDDKDYQLKYNCELRDAVTRAKANPNSLFRGFQFCLSRHIQPSANVVSSIILSAGGRVIGSLRGIVETSGTIFIACEEDTEEALLAAKMGVRTFGSEWLMSCVMRQELDLEAYQFTESL